jgi:hypothetical protein
MGSVGDIEEYFSGFKHRFMWAGDLHATARCFLDISRPTSHQYPPNERNLTTASSCHGVNACVIWRWESDFFNAPRPIGQGMQESCEGMRSRENATSQGQVT